MFFLLISTLVIFTLVISDDIWTTVSGENLTLHPGNLCSPSLVPGLAVSRCPSGSAS